MSSNSLAVMPKPIYETWFMEGMLIPNYHYVLIKNDYSDLEDRLYYYNTHVNEALQIIQNAHQYVSQFKNNEQEDLISLLVLEKYFQKTQQLTEIMMYWSLGKGGSHFIFSLLLYYLRRPFSNVCVIFV